jgi:hypothetical protein
MYIFTGVVCTIQKKIGCLIKLEVVEIRDISLMLVKYHLGRVLIFRKEKVVIIFRLQLRRNHQEEFQIYRKKI